MEKEQRYLMLKVGGEDCSLFNMIDVPDGWDYYCGNELLNPECIKNRTFRNACCKNCTQGQTPAEIESKIWGALTKVMTHACNYGECSEAVLSTLMPKEK